MSRRGTGARRAALSLGIAVVLLSCSAAHGQRIRLPNARSTRPITVTAERGWKWEEGSYEVWVLTQGFRLEQDQVIARSEEAVLWVRHEEPGSGEPTRVLAYLEGDVSIEYTRAGDPHAISGRAAQSVNGASWSGRFHTSAAVHVEATLAGLEPRVRPALYYRAERDVFRTTPESRVRPVQFEAPLAGPSASFTSGGKSIQILPRSSVPYQLKPVPGTQPGQMIAVVTGGVKVIVDGLEAPEVGQLGRVVLETDRLVYWGPNLPLLAGGRERVEESNLPLEFYLEGNIVFRQGNRLIYADRMYYNASQEYGVVLAAEVFTPVPDYEGILRLKADVLQQLNRQFFQAYGAAITSSRLGVPRYWLQSEQIEFSDVQTPLLDPFTGQPQLDPRTGEAAVENDLLATSRNNFLYVGGVPVFYWPVVATSVTKPSFYINKLAVKNDSVFGTQLLTEFDGYQLFGIRRPPEGTEWSLSADYLSERGPALGTRVDYERYGFLGLPGPYRGVLDAWGIKDRGLDDLGADRRAVDPGREYRGRVLAQHLHDLPGGIQVRSELGYVSDRNFLEQYFEREWDEEKDLTTGTEIKRTRDATVWALTADGRINDFFTQTEWLPRLDHYFLGHSLFDRITWFEHSHAGYGRLRPATAPTDPADAAAFTPLPWEADREGVHLASRNELDLPVQLGPVKFVGYVLGEVAHWGNDLTGDEVTRAYGQTGVRASLSMWRVEPQMRSELLNVDGLAHKVVFLSEFSVADANRDFTRFPLYDNLDDDSVEHFRRRFATQTFGGTTPLRFDERHYAFRSNLQGLVTSPSTEIADDLTVASVEIRQRWQTRRGAPGRQRIVDWVTFDVRGSVFPRAARDNFGADVGLLTYDFRWHLGDRLTLVSDGQADTFAAGLRTFTLGGVIRRVERGNLYVGFRSIEGPISANIVSASVTYRMTEKWLADASTAVDLGPAGNIGQTLGLTRIGESLFVRLGFYLDESRDNLGVQFAVEPRFLPSRRLGRLAGVEIPPAGAYGIE